MDAKEFERMFCDSLNDIIDKKEPEELTEHLHFVDTHERLDVDTDTKGLRIILNDGSMFDVDIKRKVD